MINFNNKNFQNRIENINCKIFQKFCELKTIHKKGLIPLLCLQYIIIIIIIFFKENSKDLKQINIDIGPK